jgi:hypothetical protein
MLSPGKQYSTFEKKAETVSLKDKACFGHKIDKA